MKTYTFPQYGVNDTTHTIVLARITDICPFSSNGFRGTLITLDTGKEIKVGMNDHEVKGIIEGGEV